MAADPSADVPRSSESPLEDDAPGGDTAGPLAEVAAAAPTGAAAAGGDAAAADTAAVAGASLTAAGGAAAADCGGARAGRPRWGLLALLLVLLAGLALALRLLLLAGPADPLGSDGYYYVVQIEDWAASGRLHVPDASWVLQLLGGLGWLLGDALLALALGGALLAAACVPAAWWAGRALARRRPAADAGAAPSPCLPAAGGAGWALACWAAASPTLTTLALDFPKNLGLAAPALAGLALAAGPPARRRSWHWVAALGCGLLVASAHRLGAGLLGLGLLGAGLGWLAGPRRARRAGRRDWLLIGLATAAAAGFALASLLLPGLLHPADLERLSGQLALGGGPPPPLAWFALRDTHPAQQLELLAAWPALGLGLWAWWRRPQQRPLLGGLLLPLAVCLFPFWRRDVLDVGYRLGLMSPLLAAPLLLLALPRPRWWARRPRWLAPLGLVAGLALVPLARSGADAAAAPPYDRYRALIARIPRPLPELLIAHQGINFLYDHLTGREAMAWAPEPELDPRRVGRLVWGVRAGEWLALAPPGAPPPVKLDADYHYAREDVFQALLRAARAQRDHDLLERLQDPRNPTRTRPAALLRNRD